MKAQELSPEIVDFVGHIKGWETLISDEVAAILQKLWNGEELSRSELKEEIRPVEVAAIWSVKNKTSINPRYVREVKRNGRIEPSREWGTGSAYRCLYKVKEVKDIKVGHERGRPATKQKEASL